MVFSLPGKHRELKSDLQQAMELHGGADTYCIPQGDLIAAHVSQLAANFGDCSGRNASLYCSQPLNTFEWWYQHVTHLHALPQNHEAAYLVRAAQNTADVAPHLHTGIPGPLGDSPVPGQALVHSAPSVPTAEGVGGCSKNGNLCRAILQCSLQSLQCLSAVRSLQISSDQTLQRPICRAVKLGTTLIVRVANRPAFIFGTRTG